MSKSAKEIADQWGPALTKAVKESDISAFRSLFAPGPIMVVLQNAMGEEMEFTVGDDGESTLTWDEFHKTTTKDLTEQDYQKTEAQCLGVLGSRMILEVGRFNTSGEVYVETYSLLTLDEENKVTCFESFSDPNMGGLMTAVGEK